MTQKSLDESLQLLMAHEKEIKDYLLGRIPQLKESTTIAINKIADFV